MSRQLLFCIRIRNRCLYLYLQLYLQLHPHDSTCASIKCSGVSGSVIVASVSHAPSIVHWYLLRLFGWTKGCGGVVGVGCVCFNGIELALLCSPCLYVWQDEPQSFGYDTFVPVKQAKLYSWDAAAALKCVPQLQLPKLSLQHRGSNGGRAEFLIYFDVWAKYKVETVLTVGKYAWSLA